MLEIGQASLRPMVRTSAELVARKTGMQSSKVELLLPLMAVGAFICSALACCCAPAAKKKRKKVGRKVGRALDQISERRKSARQSRYVDDDGDDGDGGATVRLRAEEEQDDRPVI